MNLNKKNIDSQQKKKKNRRERDQFPQDIKEKNCRSKNKKKKKKNRSRIIPKITPSGLGLQKSKRNDEHNPNSGCLAREKTNRENSANKGEKL